MTEIRSGAGADTLIGGAGADLFQFLSAGEGAGDLIVDFSSAEGDRIDLSLIDADSSTAGNDAFTFIGSGGFSGKAGELRAELIGGIVHVFADTDGNGQADMSFIVNVNTIRSDDFIL